MTSRVSHFSSLSTSFSHAIDQGKAWSKIGMIVGATIIALGLVLSNYPAVAAFSSTTMTVGLGIELGFIVLQLLARRDQRIFNKAASTLNGQVVSRLLKKPGINLHIGRARYALLDFARAGDSQLVKELIQAGADPHVYNILQNIEAGYDGQHFRNQSRKNKETISFETFNKTKEEIDSRYLAVITELHKGGFSFKKTEIGANLTGFHQIIRYNYSNLAYKILQLEGVIDEHNQLVGKIPDWMMHNKQYPALYVFSKLGIVQAVQEILKSEHHGDLDGALQEACSGGHPEMAQFLIKNGADPKAMDEKALTPFEIALSKGHLNIARLHQELSAGDHKTYLGLAARSGNADLVRYLLSEFKFESDMHAILEAVERNHMEVVSVLLEASKTNAVDITAKNAHGNNAFHLASLFGYTEMIQLLAEHEKATAMINEKNNNGMTPLHEGISQLKVVKSLISAGANVCETSTAGYTPLHFIVMGSKPQSKEIVQILIKASPDPKAYLAMKSPQGTALERAIERNRPCSFFAWLFSFIRETDPLIKILRDVASSKDLNEASTS